MARQALINTADDMRWLRDVHLPRLSSKYKSAMIVGNEDYPDRIEIYERRDPRVSDVPVIFEANAEGIFQAKSKARHATKKVPAQIDRRIFVYTETGPAKILNVPARLVNEDKDETQDAIRKWLDKKLPGNWQDWRWLSEEESHATKTKSRVQLEREIAEALNKPPKRHGTSRKGHATRS